MPGKRVVYNSYKIIKEWNKNSVHNNNERLRFIRRYNSYCGLLKHSKSYYIRRRMWKDIIDRSNLVNTSMNKINLI